MIQRKFLKEFKTEEQRKSFIDYILASNLQNIDTYSKIVLHLDYRNNKFVLEY